MKDLRLQTSIKEIMVSIEKSVMQGEALGRWEGNRCQKGRNAKTAGARGGARKQP